MITKHEFLVDKPGLLIPTLLAFFDGTVSHTTIQKALRNKDVRVNDERTKANKMLAKGDRLSIFLNSNKPNVLQKKYEVVYQDDNLLIVNKEQGFAVHADGNREDNLLEQLRRDFKGEKISLCHRIDRNTGGLVVVALNELALNSMLEAFRAKRVTKNYHAITVGCPPKEEGTLIHYLSKNEKLAKVFVYKTKAQDRLTAVTHYRLLQKTAQLCMVEYSIETGRMHQIRAQSAFAGFPILGDLKYGNTAISRQYNQKKQALFAVGIVLHFSKGDYLFYLNNHIFSIESHLPALFNRLVL